MAVNVFSVESMVGTRVRRSVGFLIGSADETRRDVTGFVLMAISKATVSFSRKDPIVPLSAHANLYPWQKNTDSSSCRCDPLACDSHLPA